MQCDIFLVFNHEVVDDKFLTLHSVFAHVELQQFVYSVFLAQMHAVEPHLRTDKVGKFLRVDFTKTFESCDFRLVAKFVDGGDAFLVVVAIVSFGLRLFRLLSTALALRLLLVANTEKWRLKDIEVPGLHQFGAELQEVGEQQEANVHTIDIGIGSHNHLVVA